jgi:hypothetical protein
MFDVVGWRERDDVCGGGGDVGAFAVATLARVVGGGGGWGGGGK